MAERAHPFHESRRDAMTAAMRERLELAGPMLRERARLPDVDAVKRQVMDELDIVLAQMPDVGGAANRMSDFFVRLLGFLAIGRVLRRHGVPVAVIGDIEREAYQAQLLGAPEDERLAAGREFLSAENQALVRAQAARHGDEELLPTLCGLDFVAYAARGIRLVRTQTLAGGASHCDFRFSRLPRE